MIRQPRTRYMLSVDFGSARPGLDHHGIDRFPLERPHRSTNLASRDMNLYLR